MVTERPSTESPAESLPDIASALNRLLTTVKWLDDDGVLRDLDNNVHLARAVSELRGHTPHVQIQRIRQGTQPDPRTSVLWAITQVVNEHAAVEVTMDYFFVPATRARVQRELDLALERLTMQARGQRG
ncbi:hypothetical protein [Nostocoides sp. Soil756]|jgi:hypothetical protein|uniref:hypothetical protein n=1 Tax=Nostocoides sp. Soil756 TaxID=1736399 RepID=UPI0006F73898|nr:hypothetical protein [Tetrasphaera sp. Soil756]KRE63593.1 hypothetical protein ASG78_01475 [Tetrasphaera sp. Soil756]